MDLTLTLIVIDMLLFLSSLPQSLSSVTTEDRDCGKDENSNRHVAICEF